MNVRASIEKRFSGAVHTLRCYAPFTPEWNRIVLEILDDVELKRGLMANDKDFVIRLLEQRWVELKESVAPKNIIKQPLIETFEAAQLAVVIEEIYYKCKSHSTKLSATYWRRWAECFALSWPLK